MTTLSTAFHPSLVGYKSHKHTSAVFCRIVDNREYRINCRSLEGADWFELEVFAYDKSGSYYRYSVPLLQYDTVESFYDHLFHKLSSSEERYLAVLNVEYRALMIDELLETL